MMILGWTTAAITGMGMPSFVFLMGDILDSFNPSKTAEDMLDAIKFTCMLLAIIGAVIWLLTYTYYASLLVFSERIAYKTRVRYLQSILKQESAWFDLTNP